MDIDLNVKSVKINLIDKIHFATLENVNKLEIEILNIKLKSPKLKGNIPSI